MLDCSTSEEFSDLWELPDSWRSHSNPAADREKGLLQGFRVQALMFFVRGAKGRPNWTDPSRLVGNPTTWFLVSDMQAPIEEKDNQNEWNASSYR